MIKQIIAVIILSIGLVLSLPYFQHAVQLLISAHDWVAQILTNVFSGGKAGNLARELIALLVLPVVVSAIPTMIYWIIKRHWFPYFMEIVWVVWLVQAGALAMLTK